MTSELSQLKVCFLAGTLTQGGAERQLFYIVRTLLDQGACLRVLSLTQGEFWEDRLREIGAQVEWVGRHRGKLPRLLRIVRSLERYRPHIVQSQHFFANLYATLGARAVGALDIGAIRSNVVSEVGANGAVLGNLSLRLPRWIAANSRSGIRMALARRAAPHRLRLLPNVIDTDHFHPRSRSNGTTVRILSAGRLNREKRFDLFLRILARLRRVSREQFQGIIAGAGPLREQLESEARCMDWHSGRTRFAGPVADMRESYEQADIFVSTSDYEGTPNVILEAMASGLPVVATAVGDVCELVEEGVTGFLVRPGDEEEAVAKLRLLVESREARIRMGQAGRARVARDHSLPRLAGFLEELYRSVGAVRP